MHGKREANFSRYLFIVEVLRQEGKEEIVPKFFLVTGIIKLLPPSFEPVLEEVDRIQGILDQSLPRVFGLNGEKSEVGRFYAGSN
jgi:hypothetical protein